jgi:TPP-dependent pyruvate/acetoin dehydrogenase alpha subunit
VSAELLDLYRGMARIRAFDDRAVRCFEEGRVYGSVHPCTGQEAIPVGVGAALEPGDRVASTHRGHGHCLAVGADPARMMAELFGRADGYCKGKGGSMHVADIASGMLGANGVVAAGVPIAAGAALAAQLDGGDRVAVAFFSDGATGQGILYETLNLAALWELPLVLVCENNRFGVDMPVESALAVERFATVAEGHGVPAEVVDGNDPLAVRAAARRAVERARGGGGPSVLECLTQRIGVHSVNIADGRADGVREVARAADPLPRLRAQLLAAGVGAGELERIESEIAREIDAAVAFAEASPFPAAEDALEDVFA